MDQKLEHTASIVNAFVDLVDEEDKKQDILTSWKTFEIEVWFRFGTLYILTGLILCSDC